MGAAWHCLTMQRMWSPSKLHLMKNFNDAESTGTSQTNRCTERHVKYCRVKPGFHYPSRRPELTGDRFPLPVNTGRVDGRAYPLAELTGRVVVLYLPIHAITGGQLLLYTVNTGRVDGRAFPLAELTGRVDGPSTWLVETLTR